MKQPLVVPDASVILKWVLPIADEYGSRQALRLRDALVDDTVRIVVPALWLFEVGNVIARQFPETAARYVDALLKLGLEEAMPSNIWVKKTLELVARYDVTFYDAAYHALALVSGGELVTADERYLARTKAAGAASALAEWLPPAPAPRRRK